jgi:exopolyphosphatase/guanosine-5'-triphosphate,3'-diphosphate pyrophosphatase
MRIAAIDIGSNSIHMVIARASGGTGFEVVDREREVVQIGRDSFERGRLRASAMRRTIEALARFVDLARRMQADRILCTTTAAVREARNGGEFVQAARKAAGVTPRVIPAEEEGRLIYLGVRSAVRLDEEPALIVDIGGGSTQFVVADRERFIESFGAPLGALRLTECVLRSDPPSRRDLQRLRRHIRRRSAEALHAVAALKPRRVYGSSGSIHALAQLAHIEEHGRPLDHLNGHVLTAQALRRLTRRLQRMSPAAREKLAGLDNKRAEIIVAGAMVLDHVLDELEADAITISDFGVREGLVTDYLATHAPEIKALGDVEELRLRSVLQMLQKFQPEERQQRHARHVARLSLQLFDGLEPEHGLGAEAREMLHYAALLHDVGAVVGYDNHGQHSNYIIRNGSLRGLSADEVLTIATVARYHGKPRPRKRDPGYGAMTKPRRRAVKWLSAVLRIAEGLDRSHYQLVQEVRVVRRRDLVTLVLTTRRGARLEVWASRRRLEPLARLVRARVRIEPRAPVEAGVAARRRAGASGPPKAVAAPARWGPGRPPVN